jgi:hypothetical protein
MSKYRKMQTKFTSRFRLREALKATGISFSFCSPHSQTSHHKRFTIR